MGIGAREIVIGGEEESVNWRGIITLGVVTLCASVLYATGILEVPFVLVAPMTIVMYVVISWAMRDKARSRAARRVTEE